MIKASQLIVALFSSNVWKHQWWSTECMEKEDDPVFASMKEYSNRSPMHSLNSSLSPAHLANQRGTSSAIARSSAGARSLYQRSPLSRNAHSIKRLVASSLCNRRELKDSVHVVRMLRSASSRRVERCCFSINLAHAWLYNSMYSETFVPVFRMYDPAWLIAKGRPWSRLTSSSEPYSPQTSDRVCTSMLLIALTFC